MEPFPRPRRLRRTASLRRLVRETVLSSADLIHPIFVQEAPGRFEIASMPGVHRHDLESAVESAGEARSFGVPAAILFGIPSEKDATGSGAHAEGGAVQEATRAIKAHYPDLTVVTDTCLCEYTDHGHCGPLLGDTVDNDASLRLLAKTALSQARAGADVVAPSAMMDGQVGAIRRALDEGGFAQTAVLAYAVKYASGFYGPFREAADSAPARGDRAGYQMDPGGGYREARREAQLDTAEGADMLMVKPALAYLDVLRLVRDEFDLPLVAYNVSGEYAMVKAAALRGWIDGRRVTLETLTSLKRAGADAIITYHALETARWLKEG